MINKIFLKYINLFLVILLISNNKILLIFSYNNYNIVLILL